MMRTRFLAVAAALTGLLATAAPARAAFVVNGGFETGDFSGWTQFGNLGFTGVTTGIASEGVYGAFFGPVDSTGGISQVITGLTVGKSYSLTFSLLNNGGNPNSFASSVNGTPYTTFTNAAAFPYTFFDNRFTATSTTATIAFNFQQNPSYYFLDNVSVSAVPAPPAVALALMGLASFGGIARLRRRVATA